MASIQRQLAHEFFTFIENRDYDAIANLMSENYSHNVFPVSVGGFASLNKQQALELLKALWGMVETFNFQPPRDIVQGQDTIVYHIATDGKTVSGNEYKNEFMFTIRFEGEKIANVREFLDSKYMTKAVEREIAAGVEGARYFGGILG